MNKIVYKYLSEYYYIDKSEMGNDGIYSKIDIRRYKAPVRGLTIITEVSSIFNLTTDKAKEIIISWTVEQFTNINLEFYWKTPNDFLLPLAQAIASRTIAQDLVSVQPINTPTSNLLFLDAIYNGKTV